MLMNVAVRARRDREKRQSASAYILIEFIESPFETCYPKPWRMGSGPVAWSAGCATQRSGDRAAGCHSDGLGANPIQCDRPR
jgi:hypothetical protein